MKNIVRVICLIVFSTNFLFGQVKKRLASPINTGEFMEYAPSISADGTTLIYQSNQYGILVSAVKGVPKVGAEGKENKIIDEYEASFSGIYEAKVHRSGEYYPPKQIEAINSFFQDGNTPVVGGPSISYDGNTLFLFANVDKKGFGEADIYFSTREKQGWSTPQNIGSTINSENYEGFPSISPDARKLYFVREIIGKKVEDKQCYKIMVSEKARNGKWRTPYELPAVINQNCEKAPRILADGKTLVFSSIKAEGKGDFDLYKSVLQDDGTWSKPLNLDFVNTKKSDQFVSISPCGDLMYYVANGDIYTTTVPEELRPFKSATVQGFVLDSLTQTPIPAKIVVKNLETKETFAVLDNNPSDGRFTALLPINSEYEISVNLSEYYTKSFQITKDFYQNCELISKDFRLQSLPAPEQVSVAASKPAVPQENVKKNIEEVELVGESTETKSEKILAQGEKPTDSKEISDLTLIVRVVNKNNNEIIKNVNILLKYDTDPSKKVGYELIGEDYVMKVKQGDAFEMAINCEGFLTFSAKIPSITQDRRVTVKLVPIEPSFLNIHLYDVATNKSIKGTLVLYAKNTQDSVEVKTDANGFYRLELTKNMAYEIICKSDGYLPLKKTIDIELPKEGNKIYELEARLVVDEYELRTKVVNIENGLQIASAKIELFDSQEVKILELQTDTNGEAFTKFSQQSGFVLKCSVDGFQSSTQELSEIKHFNSVLFKLVPIKVPTNELKVRVMDYFTGEEVAVNVQINGKKLDQKSPFMLSGTEKDKFKILLSNDGFEDKTYDFGMDSVMNKTSTKLYIKGKTYPFEFSVFSKKDRSKINALVEIVDFNTKESITVQRKLNNVLANLAPEHTYVLRIKANGFEEYARKITILDWVKEQQFEQEFVLIPTNVAPIAQNSTPAVIETKAFGTIERGKAVILNNINFDQSSPVLRTTSFEELDKLVALLTENVGLQIEIRGHTDNVGDFDLNVKLSQERCQSVRDYLVKKGIEVSRLKTLGKGPLEPLVANSTEENKKKNRRVEFRIL
ncbi:MAG: OmpA family protein [Emticicia sp.]|nr:OmpA family protein [Emticicia sp.]